MIRDVIKHKRFLKSLVSVSRARRQRLIALASSSEIKTLQKISHYMYKYPVKFSKGETCNIIRGRYKPVIEEAGDLSLNECTARNIFVARGGFLEHTIPAVLRFTTKYMMSSKKSRFKPRLSDSKNQRRTKDRKSSEESCNSEKSRSNYSTNGSEVESEHSRSTGGSRSSVASQYSKQDSEESMDTSEDESEKVSSKSDDESQVQSEDDLEVVSAEGSENESQIGSEESSATGSQHEIMTFSYLPRRYSGPMTYSAKAERRYHEMKKQQQQQQQQQIYLQNMIREKNKGKKGK